MNTKVYKLFLAGIAYNFTDEQVLAFFSKRFNSVFNVDLVKQKGSSGLNRGCGFLELTSKEEMETILDTEFFYLKERRFSAKKYKKGKELKKYKKSLEKRRLFVHNVDSRTTNDELISFFSSLAPIENAYLIDREIYSIQSSNGEINPNLRYGYVVMRKVKDAERLLKRKYFQIGDYEAILKKYDPVKHSQFGASNDEEESRERISDSESESYFSPRKGGSKKKGDRCDRQSKNGRSKRAKQARTTRKEAPRGAYYSQEGDLYVHSVSGLNSRESLKTLKKKANHNLAAKSKVESSQVKQTIVPSFDSLHQVEEGLSNEAKNMVPPIIRPKVQSLNMKTCSLKLPIRSMNTFGSNLNEEASLKTPENGARNSITNQPQTHQGETSSTFAAASISNHGPDYLLQERQNRHCLQSTSQAWSKGNQQPAESRIPTIQNQAKFHQQPGHNQPHQQSNQLFQSFPGQPHPNTHPVPAMTTYHQSGCVPPMNHQMSTHNNYPQGVSQFNPMRVNQIFTTSPQGRGVGAGPVGINNNNNTQFYANNSIQRFQTWSPTQTTGTPYQGVYGQQSRYMGTNFGALNGQQTHYHFINNNNQLNNTSPRFNPQLNAPHVNQRQPWNSDYQTSRHHQQQPPEAELIEAWNRFDQSLTIYLTDRSKVPQKLRSSGERIIIPPWQAEKTEEGLTERETLERIYRTIESLKTQLPNLKTIKTQELLPQELPSGKKEVISSFLKTFVVELNHSDSNLRIGF